MNSHVTDIGLLPLKILLIEDSFISQQAVFIPLKNLGYQLQIASNSQDAINEYSQKLFDLILIKLNIGEKDGFQITKELRKIEQSSNRRTPIIALSANAGQEHKKCLKSGMDYILEKPFDISEFYRILYNILNTNTQNAPTFIERPSDSSSSQFVIEKAEAYFMGDHKLFKEVIQIFLHDNPQNMQSLDTAIQKKDLKNALFFIHTIKGSLATFGENILHKTAKKLEHFLTESDFKNSAQKNEDLKKLLKKTYLIFEQYLQGKD